MPVNKDSATTFSLSMYGVHQLPTSQNQQLSRSVLGFGTQNPRKGLGRDTDLNSLTLWGRNGTLGYLPLDGCGTVGLQDCGRDGTLARVEKVRDGTVAARESTGTGRRLASRDVSEPKTSQGGTFTMALTNPNPNKKHIRALTNIKQT